MKAHNPLGDKKTKKENKMKKMYAVFAFVLALSMVAFAVPAMALMPVQQTYSLSANSSACVSSSSASFGNMGGKSSVTATNQSIATVKFNSDPKVTTTATSTGSTQNTSKGFGAGFAYESGKASAYGSMSSGFNFIF